ncbi:MAG: MATE family efflux transporter [Woeseiaceae bacterium]
MKDSKRPLRGLTNGPIAPTLIAFAFPLLITNFLHTMTGTWNAVWVSHLLGPEDLVAVTNANVLLGILIGSIMGFGMAAGVSVGQSIGADDLRSAHRVVGTSIGFGICGGLVIAAVGLFGVNFIVDLIQIPAEARQQTITYFQIVCFSMPTQFFFIFTMMILRSSGDARTPFIFNLIWIGLGLALTPILLTGSFGLPKFGIAGAALSGWISNATTLVAMIIYVYRKDMPLALRGSNLRFLRPNPKILFMLAKRGIPTAAESLMVQGAYFALLTLVNAYGVVTAAGYSVAAQLWGYVLMPTMAFAASMTAMAAQNIGANQWDRVNKIAIRGCTISIILTAGMAATIYALGDLPLRLFLPDGGEPLEIAREINNIVLWSWPVVAITFGLFAIVKANGVMLPSAIIFAITMWGLRIPFANLLQPTLGEAAIWISYPVGTFTSALLAYAYYRFGKWREHELMSTTLYEPASK